MQKLISVIMISITICVIGGLAWLQSEQGNAKHEFENHLMMRYQIPMDVSVHYEWRAGTFVGSFHDKTKAEKYHVEKYSDDTFYDNYLESKWEKSYEDEVDLKLKEKGISGVSVVVKLPRGTDTALFGKETLWDGNVPLEEAKEKDIEKHFDVTIRPAVLKNEKEKEILDTFAKDLSNRVGRVTTKEPKKE